MENTLDIHDLDDSALVDARVDIEVSIDGQEAGTLSLEFWPQVAPGTVRNFLQYVSGGFYDGLTFHRVVTGFMVQGGCPDGIGSGGPGDKFDDEIDDTLQHDSPGILSMANAGPGTNGSQFFITHVATPWLDGKHTVFGHVVEDQDIVDAVEQGDEFKPVKIIRQGEAAAAFK